MNHIPGFDPGARAASIAAALVLAVMLSAPAAASPLADINLAAHRAVYELSLKEATEKSGITKAKGRLVFEMDGDACVGYTANMRIVTRLTSTNGQVSIIDTRQSAWEGPESKTMRFNGKEYLNSKLTSEVSGKADKGGMATFEIPEGTFELPPQAVFPTEQAKRILIAARKGETIDRAVVFNGTDFDKIYTAVAFIGKPKPADEVPLPDSVSDPEAFAGQRVWPVTVTYYERKSEEDAKGEQEPSYQITYTMFENGVSANLLMGYGYATIEGTLSELTMFEPTECEQ